MNAWQDILAIVMVLAAGSFVAWRSWLAVTARQGGGCGSGCGKCPSAAAGPVLQIEQPTSPAPQSSHRTAAR